ncbi:hypothetical protein QE177_04565 [Arsenophonus sp. aPb]|uniref:DUF7370 family protein n=1 Tax=Arsenophonus sp. aPb TaxID=3041619 RepID=UPI0024691521|nr:hypothetical protein [Arsenophonus sp. aPb]WGL99159.1 hypothetical protein QE177_04565 [Arsenophonus sp. aPb]
MSVKITLEQVKSQLSTMGFTTPDFIIEAMLSIVDEIDDCLDEANYSDSVKTLIKIYAVVIMLSATDVRKVSSESSPSGASRSYNYFDDGRKSLLKLLSVLDTAGCTNSLPINQSSVIIQFNVVRG